MSRFATFKEGKHCDAWCRNTLATPRAHEIANVFNADHSPISEDEVNLFKEKQKCMHAVFDKTLQTNRGKNNVREHERDYDGQRVCRKLNSFYTESTNARLSASTTLSYITSAKIDL